MRTYRKPPQEPPIVTYLGACIWVMTKWTAGQWGAYLALTLTHIAP